MQFKLRAVVIVPCAHDANSSLLNAVRGLEGNNTISPPSDYAAIVMPIASS
jgi:hypothetical protein